eukprot:gnl/TRDRNA2_/TRDRNA2_188031_c0_seq1.p1 gnl/TRDRNA2_/TRDRNA2_188031_c0~~gnl/TRDRNA2_/TRDRNA2_188031_c0_seq1.p1  ORF type:complete len:275 (-),score=52.32 gnl/TRDRNA2_/TRDRNA2_188031_c0_seq1:383-1207(-)
MAPGQTQMDAAAVQPTLLVGCDGVKDVPVPSTALPADTELAAALASELQAKTGATQVMCAVLGVAGPVLAVVHGVATVIANKEEQAQVNLRARQELRRLAHSFPSKQESDDQQAKDKRTFDLLLAWSATPMGRLAHSFPGKQESHDQQAKDERAIDLLLAWSATPIVPTYSVGVHLALGDLDEPSREVANGLAWLLRLSCFRAGGDATQAMPMLATACKALSEAAPGSSVTQREMLAQLRPQLRSVQTNGVKGNCMKGMVSPCDENKLDRLMGA